MCLCFTRNSTVLSGLCKFCTDQLLIQFLLFKNVGNMSGYDRSVTLEKFCNLVFLKPNGVFIQTYNYFGLIFRNSKYLNLVIQLFCLSTFVIIYLNYPGIEVTLLHLPVLMPVMMPGLLLTPNLYYSQSHSAAEVFHPVKWNVQIYLF